MKILGVITEFINTAEYRINKQKLSTFLYNKKNQKQKLKMDTS